MGGRIRVPAKKSGESHDWTRSMGSIRLFLACAVLISHATALEISLLPGHAAVQVFFIISGFYMSFILSEKHKTDAILFYTNRLFRLFPSYLLVLVLSFDEYFEQYSLWPLLAIVLVASLILYYAVDGPINRWRQRRVGAVAVKELSGGEVGVKWKL